jgi:hypothetical protein
MCMCVFCRQLDCIGLEEDTLDIIPSRVSL